VLLERERLAAVEGELSREIAVAFTLHLKGGLAQREYSRTYRVPTRRAGLSTIALPNIPAAG
jgi:hypothetical protein